MSWYRVEFYESSEANESQLEVKRLHQDDIPRFRDIIEIGAQSYYVCSVYRNVIATAYTVYKVIVCKY